jgi:hypothetical protein
LGGSSSHLMSTPAGACKCLHCKNVFLPDRRNHQRQRFCSEPACKKQSKRRSQQRWRAQPQNRDYFRGAAHVSRVQAWRQRHPGYWKRRPKKPPRALQDSCTPQLPAGQSFANPVLADLSALALQDLCQPQAPLLLGLVSQFLQSPLQEDIVDYVRRLIAKGRDLLDTPSQRLPKTKITLVHDSQKTPPA